MSLSEKTATIAELSKQFEASPSDVKLQNDLLAKIEELHRAVRPSYYTIYNDWAQMARIKATVTLNEHGVIRHIPNEGGISASNLAKASGMDETLIIRLMRSLTSQGIIDLTPADEPTYAHTRFSKQYLEIGGAEYSDFMLNEVTRANFGAYLKTHNVEDLKAPLKCPAVWADGWEGKDWFECLSQFPERLAIFDGAMQFDQDFIPVTGVYPFEKLAESGVGKDEPLVVDVGGGRGQSLLAIKNAYPELKGRLIVQDRPVVLATVTDEELEGIEKSDHDFFRPQPIKGAKAYYLRRVLHDWDDASAIKILKQLAMAMAPDSRVLICDLLVPKRAEPGTDLTAYWMDYAVMMLSGRERNEDEFKHLLDEAGLDLVKVWTQDNGRAWCVVEARLKA